MDGTSKFTAQLGGVRTEEVLFVTCRGGNGGHGGRGGDGGRGARVGMVDLVHVDTLAIVQLLGQVAMEVVGEVVVMVVMVGLGDLVEGEETVALQVTVVCLSFKLLIRGCWCWLRQTA